MIFENHNPLGDFVVKGNIEDCIKQKNDKRLLFLPDFFGKTSVAV